MLVTLDTILSRNGEILHAPVGAEEAVMMSVASGNYYGLNAVATRIWELLERPMTVRELCVQIGREFDVDAPTCEAEILSFATALTDNGVVHAAEA
jgi:hypothetical protein